MQKAGKILGPLEEKLPDSLTAWRGGVVFERSFALAASQKERLREKTEKSFDTLAVVGKVIAS